MRNLKFEIGSGFFSILLILIGSLAYAQTDSPEMRLAKMGIKLPQISEPSANFVHVVQAENLLFLAGKGPKDAYGNSITGKVGQDLTKEQAYQASRTIAWQHLAVLKNEIGDLSKVKRVVKVLGMVNAVPEFTDHSYVINGYSDALVEVFGDKGKHARSAVGMGSLPSNIAVEIEVIVEIEQ